MRLLLQGGMTGDERPMAPSTRWLTRPTPPDAAATAIRRVNCRSALLMWTAGVKPTRWDRQTSERGPDSMPANSEPGRRGEAMTSAHPSSMRVLGRVVGLAVALTVIIGGMVACRDRQTALAAEAARARAEIDTRQAMETERRREAALARNREAIQVPAAPTRWVTDGVGLLSEAARRDLDVSLERYEMETGHQVIVWIGGSTHGQRLEDFATRSFNAWGIGRKGANDGVAFFVFSDDRRIRLAVGDGLVGVLPDSTAAAILNEVVTPRLASGEKDQALVKGVAVTLRVLNGEQWKSLEGAFRAPASDAALAERWR